VVRCTVRPRSCQLVPHPGDPLAQRRGGPTRPRPGCSARGSARPKASRAPAAFPLADRLLRALGPEEKALEQVHRHREPLVHQLGEDVGVQHEEPGRLGHPQRVVVALLDPVAESWKPRCTPALGSPSAALQQLAAGDRAVRFFVLDADVFAELMHEWFPMAVHLLEGLFFGPEHAAGDQPAGTAAGARSLSAGLTHELNNPAAAAVRATASLRERSPGCGTSWHDRGRTVRPDHLGDAHRCRKRRPTGLPRPRRRRRRCRPWDVSDARTRSRTGWIRTIFPGMELAPTFVAAGLDVPWLDQVEAVVDPATLEGPLRC